MCPSLPQLYLADRWLSDAIFGGDSGLFAWVVSYCDHLVWRQLRSIVCFFSREVRRRGVSSLGAHIGNVVELGSEKQVVDVDATRNVATMKHTQIVGNRSVPKFPRKSMHKEDTIVDAYLAVPKTAGRANPHLTATLRNALASTLKRFDDGLCCVLKDSFHDTPHRAIEGSPVSPVWAERGLQPVVPAEAQ